MAKRTQMREALRLALMEEMRRDESVFVMGEEVGQWQGTHRVTRGFYDEFGPNRVRDTPISEMAIAGRGRRRGYERHASGGRDHDD